MLQSGFIDWVEALVPQGLNVKSYQISNKIKKKAIELSLPPAGTAYYTLAGDCFT